MKSSSTMLGQLSYCEALSNVTVSLLTNVFAIVLHSLMLDPNLLTSYSGVQPVHRTVVNAQT